MPPARTREVGEIDRRHPALPEFALEGVAVRQSTTQGVEDVHGSTAKEGNGLT